MNPWRRKTLFPVSMAMGLLMLFLGTDGWPEPFNGGEERNAADSQALILAVDHLKGSGLKGMINLDGEANTMRGVLEHSVHGFSSVRVICPEQNYRWIEISQIEKHLNPLRIDSPARLALVYFVYRGISDDTLRLIPDFCTQVDHIDSSHRVLIADVESHSLNASEAITKLPSTGTAVFCSAFRSDLQLKTPQGDNRLITTEAFVQGLGGAADRNGDGAITVKELFWFLEKACNAFVHEPKEGSCAWKADQDFLLVKSPMDIYPATGNDLPIGTSRSFAELDFVWVPPDIFFMGYASAVSKRNTKPFIDGGCAWHPVRLSSGFWMQRTEISKGQWKAIMGTEPWKGKTFVQEEDNTPAVFVSWDDAQAFIERLNAQGEGHFRLPTDAEWEYACQAGSATLPLFLPKDEFEAGVWYNGNTRDAGESCAHSCGQKKANAWGLQDMLGNVWEWCEDFHSPRSGEYELDPEGPETGAMRVLRGRSWFDGYPVESRPQSAWTRCGYRPDFRACMVGFRVCRDP